MLLLLPTPSFPANFTPSKPFCLPHRRHLLLRCKAADFDSFTERSGYLFDLTVPEADSLTEYSVSKIAAVYRRKPLILFRRLFQTGTTFGKWFALRYLDRVYDRSGLMFQVFFFFPLISFQFFDFLLLFMFALHCSWWFWCRLEPQSFGKYWSNLVRYVLFPNIEVFLKKKKKLKFHVEQSLNFYLFVQYYKFLFPFWFGQQYDIHGILNLSKMAQWCRIDLGKTGLYAWGWA